MRVAHAALPLLALSATLPLASASLFARSEGPSDFINGVHVNDAFQHQLRKDYAQLGWDVSSIVGSDAPAATDASPDVDDGLDAAVDHDEDEEEVVAGSSSEPVHHRHVARSAKSKKAKAEAAARAKAKAKKAAAVKKSKAAAASRSRAKASASSKSKAAAASRSKAAAASKSEAAAASSSKGVAAAAASSTAAAAKKQFSYMGAEKVRGVNLGSWLVTEPFMVPSLYLATTKADPAVVDEYTLCQKNGREWCTATLLEHYQTFITEQDFIDIKAAGLNHVRIPVGFWALDISGGEPYTQGQLPFLQQGVLWAQKHGLKVVMDIHGLPGSQNGQDNSGRRGNVLFYSNSSNVQRSEAVLKALVAEFTKDVYADTVTLYEPVNEPRDISTSALTLLKQYYTAAWGIINGGTDGTGYTFLSDAFIGLGSWLTFLPSAQYANVAFDKHIYSVFTQAGYALSLSARIKNYCARDRELAVASEKHVVLVGEWSVPPNDCGQSLAGLKYGPGLDTIGMASRYAGLAAGYKKVGSCEGLTGDGSTFSAAYKVQLRKLWEVQASVYEANSAGWLMWAWKLEAGAADEWSYSAGLKYGWIPQDVTARVYGNQCS